MKVNLFAVGGRVPRPDQPGADGVRHQGPAVGRGLADLSALEAHRADERQAADPRRHQRRRPGRQVQRRSPTTCTTRPASSSGAAACIVAMAPHLLVPQGHRRRRQGRRAADRVLHGLDTADTHHTANSFTLDPGGALYFQEGTFHHTQVETPWGPPRRVRQRAASFATSRGRRSSTSTSRSASPTRTATSSTAGGRTSSSMAPAPVPYSRHAVLRPRRTIPHKHARPPQVYQQRTRPCSGTRIPHAAGISPTRCRATCWSPT